MSKKMIKLLAPVAVGGTLLGGFALAGTAGAATPSTSTPAAQHGKAQAGTAQGRRARLRRAVLHVSAQAIGISPSELRTELKAGNSIAGVAGQHNVSVQTVENALVSAIDGRVNKAVSAGKLTSTQASNIEARAPGRVTKIVNHTR